VDTVLEDIFAPSSRLPTDFLNGLTEKDLACWSVTEATQVPRAMLVSSIPSISFSTVFEGVSGASGRRSPG
jgi:hypothetical protein